MLTTCMLCCLLEQDGVPTAIASLGRAGIKVWMLTGDKLETSVSISYSCSLFTNDMTVVTLREADFHEMGKAERVSRDWCTFVESRCVRSQDRALRNADAEKRCTQHCSFSSEPVHFLREIK